MIKKNEDDSQSLYYPTNAHNAKNVELLKHIKLQAWFNVHWTKLVILAKYWLWLPDDGFFVNRNMLEQPP
jgi:hypothetical protein